MKTGIDEPWLVTTEAIEISGASRKDLENWLQRDYIQIGTLHRSGRRLYSIVDLIRLRVLNDLASYIGMRRGFAAAVSENVAPRAAKVAALNDDGKLIHTGFNNKNPRHYLIAFGIPENDQFSTAIRAEPQLLEALQSLPHPVVVIPVDEIALKVTRAALAKIDEDKK